MHFYIHINLPLYINAVEAGAFFDSTVYAHQSNAKSYINVTSQSGYEWGTIYSSVGKGSLLSPHCQGDVRI